jgi:DNA (cytosine-5)-methyltransferase 1
VSVKDAIQHFPNPDEPNNVPNHTYSKYKMIFNGYLGKRRLDPDMPSPTITARGDDKGGVVVHPHYNGDRRMTGRELAAIQTFPDNFVFQGTNSSVYRQIGNAVPPLLAYHIANQFNYYQGYVR